jgi:hypothetical protein
LQATIMHSYNRPKFDWPFVVSVDEDRWDASAMLSWLKARGTFDEDWSYMFEMVNEMTENTTVGFARGDLATEFALRFL